MNQNEKDILKMLEYAFDQAIYLEDYRSIIRLDRALMAFESDPNEHIDDIFTKKYKAKYIDVLCKNVGGDLIDV